MYYSYQISDCIHYILNRESNSKSWLFSNFLEHCNSEYTGQQVLVGQVSELLNKYFDPESMNKDEL